METEISVIVMKLMKCFFMVMHCL